MSGHAENLARARAYLARFRDAGVLNRIGGEAVPAASGATFETRSPVDGAKLADVARCGRRGHRPRRPRRPRRLPRLARLRRRRTPGAAAPHRRRHRGARRRNRLLRVHGHRPGAALHVQGGAARCRELPLLRRPRARRPRRPGAAQPDADERHDPRADRPGRDHHALEHALHAVDLEDRAGARRRLHRGPQAGRAGADHRRPPARDRRGCRPAARRLERRQRLWRRSRPGADRASRDPRHRLRRRVRHRQRHHGAGGAHPQTRAFRARRQEPRGGLRRRRARARPGCCRLHDLLAERRALHLVLAPARPVHHPRPTSSSSWPRASAASGSATRSTPRPKWAR